MTRYVCGGCDLKAASLGRLDCHLPGRSSVSTPDFQVSCLRSRSSVQISLCSESGQSPATRSVQLSCPGASLPAEQGSWASCCPPYPPLRLQHHQGAPTSGWAHLAPGEPCFRETHLERKVREKAGPWKHKPEKTHASDTHACC